MTVENVVPIVRKSDRGNWSDLEPLLSQIRQHMNCNLHEAMRYMGFSGSSLQSDWKRRGPPTIAIMAAKGLLAELGQKAQIKVEKQFDLNELSRLFALASGIPIPEDQRRAIIARLAKELAR